MIISSFIISCRIEQRVEERKRKWEEDVENELKQQREATKFKARPARVLEEESFVSFFLKINFLEQVMFYFGLRVLCEIILNFILKLLGSKTL